MFRKRLTNASACWGAIAVLCGAGIAQAANNKPVDESREAAGLLREIKSDAAQIHSAAVQLDHLTKGSSAKWVDLDRQWNVMKPAQEDMEQKLWRLESIKASISPAEQTQLAQTKPVVDAIQSNTHRLRTLLDKPEGQVANQTFEKCAISLRRETNRL